MYTPWLSPFQDANTANYPPASIGHQLSYRGVPPTVALIGLRSSLADAVRYHLYRHAWDFGDLAFADFGNLRKETVAFAVPLLRELGEAGIIPILLAAEPGMLKAQSDPYLHYTRTVNHCRVDSRLPGPWLEALMGGGVHLTHIGSQRHLVDPAILARAEAEGFEVSGLGSALDGLDTLEPAIRDADLFSLDIGAIQYAEAPARPGFNPSGLSLRGAGQLCYYAGHADRLTSFALSGAMTEGAPPREGEVTAAAYAQLVWYFLLGVSRRAGDFPASSEGMTEYVVDLRPGHRLVFWRSPRTERWWLQIPTASGRDRHLVACSYDDYLAASRKGRLVDRLSAALLRF